MSKEQAKKYIEAIDAAIFNMDLLADYEGGAAEDDRDNYVPILEELKELIKEAC